MTRLLCPEPAKLPDMKKLICVLLATTSPALAEGPEIVKAEARASGTGWTVSVTLRHPDTGWDHYADGWEVRAPDGMLLGERPLAHPHENEQPFTRSLSRVAIPDDLPEVLIRARCNHGDWANEDFVLKLSR